MKAFREQINTILAANGSRAVLATRDEAGCPYLAPLFFWYVDDTSIWFSLGPSSRTRNHLKQFPEAAVSLVNWDKFEGLQVKGVATMESMDGLELDASTRALVASFGNTAAFRLTVQEVYDIIPGKDKDLRKPLWTAPGAWSHASRPPTFRTPDIAPRAMPSILRSELSDMCEVQRNKFVPAYVATTNEQGVPNISPRFILEVGEDYWFYGDGFRNKTFMNASRPSPLAIAVVDWVQDVAFTARGWSEVRFSGEYLAKVRSYWEQMNFKPAAVQAVLFRPESIDRLDLKAPKPVFSGNQRTAWLGVA